jgi:hypothetical protein
VFNKPLILLHLTKAQRRKDSGVLSKPRAILRALVSLCEKKGKKFWLPLTFVFIFLLFVGIMAITQEAEEDSDLNDMQIDGMLADFQEYETEGEPLPPWIPPGPPRWFRSNAGGMTLEEVSSRLTALRNKYALVIDYVAPDELEPRLLPFYHSDYTIEIRILYKQKEESRRQWLFRDEAGVIRLNAVFVQRADEPPDEQFDYLDGLEEELTEAELIEEALIEAELIEEEFAEIEEELENFVEDQLVADSIPEPDPSVAGLNRETALSVGFIEFFNEQARIIEDHWLFDDDSEILVSYFYNGTTLISAETREKFPDEEYRTMYVDNYRYNRSYSLRHVERVYHEAMRLDPVRLTFPGRVLDAASDRSFFNEKLPFGSEFMGTFLVEEGFRILYETDSRGRILTQTMVDSKNETVWMIKNTWLGDRIIAMLKKEGEDEKLTEYEFDDAKDRVVQRDIHNGVLERVVYTEGKKETEELYLDGILVLKAYWEDGKKISEERQRRR